MKHPGRYPKHDGDKGTVFGGECNRTSCQTHGATMFNKGTFGYYCKPCAIRINHFDTIVVPVDHDLSIEEMNAQRSTI